MKLSLVDLRAPTREALAREMRHVYGGGSPGWHRDNPVPEDSHWLKVADAVLALLPSQPTRVADDDWLWRMRLWAAELRRELSTFEIGKRLDVMLDEAALFRASKEQVTPCLDSSLCECGRKHARPWCVTHDAPLLCSSGGHNCAKPPAFPSREEIAKALLPGHYDESDYAVALEDADAVLALLEKR
ncbi:MAG: hypothetical protein KGL39_57305 [Patescibacteria group bacterium]|nr:hypothetical protein [Patescibacteria group bacterium]